MSSKRIAFKAAVFTLLLLAAPASAHRVSLFASAEGDTVTGSVYFGGGGKAKGVPVQVMEPGGDVLLSLVTDDDGQFKFTAPRRCDYTLICDSGDGHRADFMIAAGELPAALPECESGTAPAPPQNQDGAMQPVGQDTVPPPPQVTPDMVDRAVAKHIGELRREIAAYQEKVFFHSIVGGIGYIVGCCGLIVLLKSRKPGKEVPRD